MDVLYNQLHQAWVKSHPNFSTAQVRENVMAFWNTNIDYTKVQAEAQRTVHEKIKELSQGSEVRNGQPTLKQLWFGNKDKNNKENCQEAKKNFRKRRVETSTVSGTPIVITIEEDGDNTLENVKDPLVVLEVVRLEVESNSLDSVLPYEEGTAVCGIDGNQVDLENQSHQGQIEMKELEVTNENVFKMKSNCEKPSSDYHDIRIRSLSSLMEPSPT